MCGKCIHEKASGHTMRLVPVQWRNAVGRKLAETNEISLLNIFYVNKIFDF